MASAPSIDASGPQRSVRVNLTGHVQGVGFRPFVYRIANELGLTGQVLNKVGEVEVIACGSPAAVDQFCADVIARSPPLSRPLLESVVDIDAPGCTDFTIAPSADNADAKIFVPPDYFLCDDCRSELHDANDRRFRYPFINCTQCGPRYTLIERLPYDRPNTSMAAFPLCADCLAEYEDPTDRRFHAEPVACPECGPQVSFHGGGVSATGEGAIAAALGVLQSGGILAVKGVGGYHLLCDAADKQAVARLRERKHRPDKPLAVMFPVAGDDGLAAVNKAVRLTKSLTELLCGPMRPIVLAEITTTFDLAPNLAPGLAELGVFLPYAPLHQLLLADFGKPVVATSGNISGEPVLTDNEEAAERLANIADAFLHHDRPILRPADDPVFRLVAGRPRPLRIGRGAAPREIELPWQLRQPTLAVGGHMKGTVAIGWNNRAVISPHIGEMDSPRSMAVFERVVSDLQSLYGVSCERLVCDKHPGYATHRWAKQSGQPLTNIWHHFAHAAALVAEHPGDQQWLVFAWDGVGLGPDGTLWGGEALIGAPGRWRRVASMRPFRLPGGERAGRQPWRSAAALHWETGSDWPACPDKDGLAKAAWLRGMNAPETTAVGRLFDAASALVCDTQHVSFEAQGPMQLEALCRGDGEVIQLDASMDANGVLRSDWASLLPLLANTDLSAQSRAEAFHSSLAAALADQVRILSNCYRFDQIGLTGGVFQNRTLTDQVIARLKAANHAVVTSEKLPCNDAAISFGQLAEIAATDQRESA